jgi:hypothetical protein
VLLLLLSLLCQDKFLIRTPPPPPPSQPQPQLLRWVVPRAGGALSEPRRKATSAQTQALKSLSVNHRSCSPRGQDLSRGTSGRAVVRDLLRLGGKMCVRACGMAKIVLLFVKSGLLRGQRNPASSRKELMPRAWLGFRM